MDATSVMEEWLVLTTRGWKIDSSSGGPWVMDSWKLETKSFRIQ